MSPSRPPHLTPPLPPVLALVLRRLAALCAALAAVCFSPPARAAAPPSAADPDPDPLDVFLDGVRGERAVQDAPRGTLAVGVEATLHMSSQQRTSFGAMAFLVVPFERLAAPPRRALVLSPPLDPGRTADLQPVAEPPPAPAPPPPSTEPPPAPLLSPELARGAVRAALRTAKLDDAERRLDSLASRARTSALLPELRLRATRAIDESESLAPTEYDPTRRTATGGTSTWLEARATFRLDRLVFADDELAIEKLRITRAAERGRLVAKVLELLDTWQRARTAEADPAAAPDARARASLAAAASEASLDVLTGGWFSKAILTSTAGGAARTSPSSARTDGADPRAADLTPARDPLDDRGAHAAPDSRDPHDIRGTVDARDQAAEARSGARNANDRTRDANESARRAAASDRGAANGAHDASRPSPSGRAAARKK